MSWWLDKDACATTEALRDCFKIHTFIELGTYRGINLKFWSYRFDKVIGVEVSKTHFWETRRRLNGWNNAAVVCGDSSQFLTEFVAAYYQNKREDIVFIYHDAHFYTQNKKGTKEARWTVLRELNALAGFKNCVLAIHDFHCGNGLYGLVYDDEPLDFELIGNALMQINPNFSYYINMKEHCNPRTAESIIGVKGLDPDFATLETIFYHNSPKLKCRGILYAVPQPLNLLGFTLAPLKL